MQETIVIYYESKALPLCCVLTKVLMEGNHFVLVVDLPSSFDIHVPLPVMVCHQASSILCQL
mgnify:FL=1